MSNRKRIALVVGYVVVQLWLAPQLMALGDINRNALEATTGWLLWWGATLWVPWQFIKSVKRGIVSP